MARPVRIPKKYPMMYTRTSAHFKEPKKEVAK